MTHELVSYNKNKDKNTEGKTATNGIANCTRE